MHCAGVKCINVSENRVASILTVTELIWVEALVIRIILSLIEVDLR